MTDRLQGKKYSNLKEFDAAIQKVWAELPEAKIKSTCLSFRRRIRQVIENEGGQFE